VYTIEELIDERNRELYDAIVQEIPIVLQESGDDGWAAIIRDGRLSWASPMYNIAKAGVYKFTRDLAAAMIGHGIYVNSVSPGWSMDTDFAKVPDKKAAEEMFKKETPVRRGTTARDIAVAVAFFASDLTLDIVGQILSISGVRRSNSPLSGMLHRIGRPSGAFFVGVTAELVVMGGRKRLGSTCRYGRCA
jgi:hypothetical protein